MRESTAAKARRLLTELRVVVTAVDPYRVEAVVRGDTGTFHTVTGRRSLWRCTCPGIGDRCAHVAAVRMVTAPRGLPTNPPPTEEATHAAP